MLLPRLIARQIPASATGGAGRLLGVALIAMSLSACFKPMLAEQPGTTSVTSSLGTIYIEVASDRIGQRLRNHLINFFSSPNDGGAADYRMTFTVSKSVSDALVQLNTDVLARTVNLNARFTLVENASGDAVHSGTTFARATYEKTAALFANERAELDAENRATDTVAEAIRAQVAAYFAAQGS
ncbi:MAG: hypothetical protein K8F25_06475 [Fimbriimonadaceae bacterium]|nr:hypothetical protein [Alphaproteobacteria bacterium]